MIIQIVVQITLLSSTIYKYKTILLIPTLTLRNIPQTLNIIFVTFYGYYVSLGLILLWEINRNLLKFTNISNQKSIKPPLIGSLGWELPNFAERVKQLRKVHLEMTILLSQLNGAFGLVLILIITSTFCGMNIDCFVLYRSSAVWSGTHTSIAIYVVLRFCCLLITVIPTGLVRSENNKTALILCKFDETEDPTLNSSIDRFLQQLNEAKNIFSLCGMLNLGMALLVSMIASLSTYMVILIQFDNEIISKINP
ncbi:gustatory receptor for sugar taste 43a-like [Uranotaenia lowii]|uniref:gustatory receptor for sugar taste 43a-like n=1 Tax=Uranotaenia lowii TaxID=190385 RepID=UPI00247AA2E5|nr:gustatory receptor for sugar taste 43a-like [Uranotaenia lowii]